MAQLCMIDSHDHACRLSSQTRPRANCHALKIKFLFDPHIILDIKSWISKRSGLHIEVEFITSASNNLTSAKQKHHRSLPHRRAS
jgi:hypothetical protein